MKRFFIIVTIILSVFFINAMDIDAVDELNNSGKHEQALSMLKDGASQDSPDAAIIWRTARAMFEIADSLDKTEKTKKVDSFTAIMDYLKPYLEIQNGEKKDRAFIVFYYGSSLGSKSKILGVKESLDSIPVMKKYSDIAISIDPSLASAYFLKAKIEEELPTMFGGDKFQMGEYFRKAIQYNSSDLTIVHDAANALYNRNWDAKKKTALSSKSGLEVNDFINRDDREISKEILTNGIKSFSAMKNPSARDKAQYENILKLKAKFK